LSIQSVKVGVQRSAFNVQRSAFGVRRSPFTGAVSWFAARNDGNFEAKGESPEKKPD